MCTHTHLGEMPEKDLVESILDYFASRLTAVDYFQSFHRSWLLLADFLRALKPAGKDGMSRPHNIFFSFFSRRWLLCNVQRPWTERDRTWFFYNLKCLLFISMTSRCPFNSQYDTWREFNSWLIYTHSCHILKKLLLGGKKHVMQLLTWFMN